MKKLTLLFAVAFSTVIFAQQQSSNNSSNNYARTETSGFDNINTNTTFENNEAMHDISKYYFDIKKYIKSKKEQLSKDEYKLLMKQNENDFTTINSSVNNTGAKMFLNKYSEDLEKYKKRILEQVDLLAKN